MNITVFKTISPKKKPDQTALGFGKYFSDHMLLLDYSETEGWHNGRIVPYAPLELDPASMVLHYGQEIFEGLKAYRGVDGKIRLFRHFDNVRRFNKSCERLCVPAIDEELFIKAIIDTVKTDMDWIPSQPDSSLYIRPFLIATDPFVGVRASNTYKMIIILSPVGAYYSGGMAPTSILVEDEDVRACRGGLGNAKTAANYAATIRAQEVAKKKGFTQVMWLDALERKYIEEIGTSNAFFVINNTVITPPLAGTILPGITRDSAVQLLKKWNIKVEERMISIDEVFAASQAGTLNEAFATGTAAVISPIGSVTYKDATMTVNNDEVGQLSQRLYDHLTGLQWGKIEDDMGWTTVI